MGWFQSGLFGLAIIARPVAPPLPVAVPAPVAVPSPVANALSQSVVANCDDFVRIADKVYSGRTGAWFVVGNERAYLSGDTFGPQAVLIGGIDPALYLAAHCGHR